MNLESIIYWALESCPLTNIQVKPLPNQRITIIGLSAMAAELYSLHMKSSKELHLSSITEVDDNPFDRTRGVIMPVRESRKFDKTGRTQAKKKKKRI